MGYRESDMTEVTEYARMHTAYICTHTYFKSESSSTEGLIFIKVS